MQGFLAKRKISTKETVSATKEKLDGDEALALAHAANRVVVARGKKIVEFNMKQDPPDDETLLSHMLGRSGTLRAPTIRRGKTLMVGFNEDELKRLFA